MRRQHAFFPLWPSLLSLGPAGRGRRASLMVVASAAAFLGVAALNPSGDARGDGHRAGVHCPARSRWLLLYPDALALACAVWACVLVAQPAARRSALGGAVVLAGAAAARRGPNGLLVAIPLAWLAYRHGRGVGRWLAAAAPLGAAAAVHGFLWSRTATRWRSPTPSRAGAAASRGTSCGACPATSPAATTRRWRRCCSGLGAIGLCVVLWRRGPGPRIWAVYATAVLVAVARLRQLAVDRPPGAVRLPAGVGRGGRARLRRPLGGRGGHRGQRRRCWSAIPWLTP